MRALRFLSVRVALRKESVDRNCEINTGGSEKVKVALRKESVDRNLCFVVLKGQVKPSLSARRAWIEIIKKGRARRPGQTSLSARRAWIEITYVTRLPRVQVSLSARRAWIEMQCPD